MSHFEHHLHFQAQNLTNMKVSGKQNSRAPEPQPKLKAG